MMHIKTILIVLIIGAVYLNESEAAPKLGLIKAKVALAKVPHVLATVSVAKEVKAKAKIAAVKSLAAAKAAKVAAISALTAPFRIAKKKIALKLGALKALKALKIAKIAKAVSLVKTLKKSPIIIPVPVVLPAKGLSLPSLPSFPSFPLPSLPKFPEIPNFLRIPPPSLAESLGPIQGFISSASKAFQTAGENPISQLISSFGTNEQKTLKEPVSASPVYRYVPEVEFRNLNKVSYQPQLEVEVPSVVPIAPRVVYSSPVVNVGPVASVYGPPVVPHSTYGVPN